jgi:hypothetical protein
VSGWADDVRQQSCVAAGIGKIIDHHLSRPNASEADRLLRVSALILFYGAGMRTR